MSCHPATTSRCRIASLALLLALQLLAGCKDSSPPPPSLYRLSGTLSGPDNASVQVALVGHSTASVSSGPDGAFAFEGLAPGQYQIVPQPSTSYLVTPERRSVTLVDQDVGGLDFALAIKTFDLTGTVTGSVVEGITIGLGRDHRSWPYTAVTDASGTFTFRDVPIGNYWAAPISPEWRHEPATATVFLDRDVSGVAFALVEGRQLSGTVAGTTAPVRIELLAGGRAVTTDAAGHWRMGSLDDGQVVVAPRLSNHTFEPGSRAVTVAGADVAGVDFVARLEPACSPVGLATQNPLPHGSPLSAVWAAAPDDVWAAGGVLLHWDGVRWGEHLACRTYLSGLWGSGPGDVWAVGEEGTILHWDGAAWTLVSSPTRQALGSVWGSGPDDVWAVGEGGTIVHWDGTAWTEVPSGTTSWLGEIRGAGPDDAWAVGGEVVLHWDGSSWTPEPVEPWLLGLWVTTGDGWAVGWDGAFTRLDGTTWQPATTPFGEGFNARSVWGSGPGDVWVAGTIPAGGAIAHFDGATWSLAQVPFSTSYTFSYLYGIAGLDATHAWAVGVSGSVLSWDGTAWSDNASGSRRYISATWGFGAGQAWAFDGGILGWDGSVWKPTPLPTGLATPLFIRSAWGSGPDDVWAGGSGGVLLHWDGADWAAMVSPTTAEILGIWGTGAGDLWLVGTGGKAFRRPAGGAWAQVDTGTTDHLLAISGSGPDDAWVVSHADGLLHWDGAAFTAYPGSATFRLRDVAVASPTEAWAVSDLALAFRWDGTTWTPDAIPISPFGRVLPAVCASGPGDVWVTGDAGVVAHWDGTAWTRVPSATRDDLRDVACDASGQVRAVGDDGAIVAR